MSHDHSDCYVTYLGELARSITPEQMSQLKEMRDNETKKKYLLKETGNTPVAVPAEVVVGFIAYLQEVGKHTLMAQLINPEITRYLDTILQMLSFYLFASVDQAAFVRDCLETHDHAVDNDTSEESTPAPAGPVDATDLLSSLGFKPAEIARLNNIAANHRQ